MGVEELAHRTRRQVRAITADRAAVAAGEGAGPGRGEVTGRATFEVLGGGSQEPVEGHSRDPAGARRETAVVQRRYLRAARTIKAGEALQREMIVVLRPATPGAIPPYEIASVLGTRAIVDIPEGKELRWTDVGE